jgi:ADP-heptose:LPS heptosyltransferase
MKKILVIKLGALGDWVQAMPAMAQIRKAHPQASITVLTTPFFTDFAKASGLFDAVETDGRPKGLRANLALFSRLRRARYERVYDLQTSSRTRNYFYAFWPFAPEWSGISPGASHRHKNPRRNQMQTLDRQWDQLVEAGVATPLPPGQTPAPDLSWAATAATRGGKPIREQLGLSQPFALLAPGASSSRPLKRWPAKSFAALAKLLQHQGVTPVVIGGAQEAGVAEAIQRHATQTVILTGRTNHVELAALGGGAALTVGNDTGPTYLAAFGGSPAVVLFSKDSDPALCAPRSERLIVLQSDDLADLSVEEVSKACAVLLSGA